MNILYNEILNLSRGLKKFFGIFCGRIFREKPVKLANLADMKRLCYMASSRGFLSLGCLSVLAECPQSFFLNLHPKTIPRTPNSLDINRLLRIFFNLLP